MVTEKKYYLKESLYFEPLFNFWYAWPYLIPPVTGARYMDKTHLRIMRSFVNNYQLHILAARESELSGGEFLDCTEEQVDEIRQLIDTTEKEYRELLHLSKAVNQLDELLRNHVDGTSLEPLYEQVPDVLRGYVELVFDREHRASFRLIEPLLYKSTFYKPELQRLSFGLLSRVKERPFVLSTPRLPDDNHMQVNVDFNNALIDQLFKARTHPVSMKEVESLFEGLELKGGLTPSDLFTDQPPEFCHKPVESGVRLQYLGHAGFMVESKDVSLLVDPVIATRGPEIGDQVVSFTQLPEHIDYVCLTHTHQDHVNFETLLQLRHKIGTILVPKSNGGDLVDPSLKLMLQQLQFKVLEMDECEALSVMGGAITSIPFLGEHGDLNVRSKSAWLVDLEGKRMFFGADSANPDINLYTHMQDLLKDLDVYAIGMECVGAPYTWLYGALCTDKVDKSVKESRRLNGSDAKQAFQVVELIKPERVLIYALGMEPWYKYFMGIEYNENSQQIQELKSFTNSCGTIGIPAESLYGKREVVL